MTAPDRPAVAVQVLRSAGPAVSVQQVAGVGVQVQRGAGSAVSVQLPGLPGPTGLTAEVYVFNQMGPLQVISGRARVYLEAASQLLSVRASVGGVGGDVTLALLRNAAPVATLTVGAGAFTALAAGALPALAAGDWLSVDVLAVAGPVPASDLSVTVRTAH